MQENGLITVFDAAGDVASEIPMLQCVHCGSHFPRQPGSGKVRGWCVRCHGPICGPGCAACVPYEQQIENIEAGLPATTPGRLLLPTH